MNLQELQRRIETWENLHTEFKQQLIRPADLARTLVAFANTDGGQLILGVTEERAIVGLDDADAVMRNVDNVAYNNCEPPLTIVQETVATADGQPVVVVNIPKGSQRPYRASSGYYIRTTSGRRQASRQELLRLFQSTASLYYDERPILRATIKHLVAETFEQFFEETRGQTWYSLGLSFERALVNLSLAREVDGDLYPTLAGLLFFARRPQQFIPHAYITALRFPGTSIDLDPSDQKRIEGPMQTMLEDAMRFLNVHLPTPHRIKGLEPEALHELPADALREALVNALAHRDYTIQGPVRVFIFDDRVEIRSPGDLPNTVTLEALTLGIHVLRNPTLYNLFLRVGLVTDAGSGIPRMIARVRRATGKPPTLKLEGNEFVVVLPRRTGEQA
ncbi:MAG: ATP-binding protein [Chloroflexota bacterium]|nr:ATP-binding protein [Chloroflexota bacterium]